MTGSGAVVAAHGSGSRAYSMMTWVAGSEGALFI